MDAAARCAACGAAMAWCEVGVDVTALEAALLAGDAAAASALRPWQCTACGGVVPAAGAGNTLQAMVDAHAAHRLERARAFAARDRFESRNRRLARDAAEEVRQRAERGEGGAKSAVAAALARARDTRRGPAKP